MAESTPDITEYLARLEAGDRSAGDELLPLIYDDLRAIARGVFGRQDGHTLQPTAVVHEAYLRLVNAERKGWTDRKHFLRVAAMAMRQLLADHARARRRQKRGGNRQRVVLEQAIAVTEGGAGIDLVALDEALAELERLSERQARIVELRFLVGLGVDEVAEVLGVSRRTVSLDWDMARSFLRGALGET